MSMADSKLIFQFKWPNWISTASFCWTRLKSCFFSVPVPKQMASAPFFLLLPVKGPVLLTPGASSQLDVTQKSWR